MIHKLIQAVLGSIARRDYTACAVKDMMSVFHVFNWLVFLSVVESRRCMTRWLKAMKLVVTNVCCSARKIMVGEYSQQGFILLKVLLYVWWTLEKMKTNLVVFIWDFNVIFFRPPTPINDKPEFCGGFDSGSTQMCMILAQWAQHA